MDSPGIWVHPGSLLTFPTPSSGFLGQKVENLGSSGKSGIRLPRSFQHLWNQHPTEDLSSRQAWEGGTGVCPPPRWAGGQKGDPKKTSLGPVSIAGLEG